MGVSSVRHYVVQIFDSCTTSYVNFCFQHTAYLGLLVTDMSDSDFLDHDHQQVCCI
jgi:hypothetical protein